MQPGVRRADVPAEAQNDADLLRLDLVNVNRYKVFIVLVYTVPALAIFMWSNNVDWILGWILAAGSAVGGWLAVKASLRGGEKIVRVALIAALLVIGGKLLFFHQ